VVDDGERDTIWRSVQLVAGRTGQEYNVRKGRKGGYWEDRYHATAIETGDHLLRCLVYVDLNMVRAGVVSHPSDWSSGGYNEIQSPRRKCVLVAYERLRELAGFDTYDSFREAHRKWVEAFLTNGNNVHQSRWTQGIAVGSEGFVAETKERLGIRAQGRRVLGSGKDFQLREPEDSYIVVSDGKNDDMHSQNTYFWRSNSKFSTR
jgi:putative transposase